VRNNNEVANVKVRLTKHSSSKDGATKPFADGDCPSENPDNARCGRASVHVPQIGVPGVVEASEGTIGLSLGESGPQPATFQYDLLDTRPQSNQTRVISISPSRNRQPHSQEVVSCTLETVDLDSWTDDYNECRVSAGDSAAELQDGIEPEDLLPELAGEFLFGAEPLALAVWKKIDEDEDGHGDDGAAQRCQGGSSLVLQDVSCPDRFTWGDYIALSYVWGSQEKEETILLNGFPFGVTANLHQALCALRNSVEVSQRKLRVWIDAICINQDDTREREYQVRKMHLIYSNALCVRGWVGEPSSPALVPKLVAVKELLAATEISLESWGQGGPMSAHARGSGVENSVGQAVMDVLEEFLCATFWERLWIVQEIALASSLAFWYGPLTFSPRDVLGMLTLMRQHGVRELSSRRTGAAAEDSRAHPQRNYAGLVAAINKFMSARPDVATNLTNLTPDARLGVQLVGIWRISGHQLHSALNCARTSKATDGRDKVFGLLALLPSEIAQRVTPAYGPQLTVEHVWIQFSRTCFEIYGNLNSMVRSSNGVAAEKYPVPPECQGLPSWVFDLSYSPASHAAVYGWFLPNRYSADGGLVAPIEFSEDGRTLICRGIIIDTVCRPATSESTSEQQSSPNLQASLGPEAKAASYDDLRLSLSRVFLQDPNHDFTTGDPSPLDLPYFSPQDLESPFLRPEPDTTLSPPPAPLAVVDNDKQPKSWISILQQENPHCIRGHISDFFDNVIHPIQDFEVGRTATNPLEGVRLRDLFASSREGPKWKVDDDDHHDAVEPYLDMLYNTNLLFQMGGQQLCVTGDGRLASVPVGAQRGDCIVVLGGCDMPAVLRPCGDGYKFVGGCFVDGLMKGEAVVGLARIEDKVRIY